jgi:hypothetical protein
MVKSATKDPNDANQRDCTCLDFKRCYDTTIDVSTGVKDGATIPIGANDSHWLVTPPGGTTAQAVAITKVSSWVTPPPPSQWLGSTQTPSAVGDFIYDFKFDLGQEWPSRNCRLSLQYAVDNDVNLKIDSGLPFASTNLSHSTTNFSTLHSAGVQLPSTGVHHLVATVHNFEGPAGLLVVGKIVCSCKGKGPADPTP